MLQFCDYRLIGFYYWVYLADILLFNLLIGPQYTCYQIILNYKHVYYILVVSFLESLILIQQSINLLI